MEIFGHIVAKVVQIGLKIFITLLIMNKEEEIQAVPRGDGIRIRAILGSLCVIEAKRETLT